MKIKNKKTYQLVSLSALEWIESLWTSRRAGGAGNILGLDGWRNQLKNRSLFGEILKPPAAWAVSSFCYCEIWNWETAALLEILRLINMFGRHYIDDSSLFFVIDQSFWLQTLLHKDTSPPPQVEHQSCLDCCRILLSFSLPRVIFHLLWLEN